MKRFPGSFIPVCCVTILIFRPTGVGGSGWMDASKLSMVAVAELKCLGPPVAAHADVLRQRMPELLSAAADRRRLDVLLRECGITKMGPRQQAAVVSRRFPIAGL